MNKQNTNFKEGHTQGPPYARIRIRRYHVYAYIHMGLLAYRQKHPYAENSGDWINYRKPKITGKLVSRYEGKSYQCFKVHES